MKLEKLSDQVDPVRIMYYGEYGSAKTTNLAHLAHLGNVLYINKESGLKKRPLDRLKVPTKNLLVTQPATYEELEQIFWTMKDTKKPFAGLCWDSLTDTQQGIMTEITEAKAEAAASRNIDRDPFHATQDDWQKGNEKMRRIVRRFRDLPIHIGFAALLKETVEVTDTDETVTYAPALTPGISSDIGGYMDLVCFCRVVEIGGDTEYQGLFKQTDRWKAKDRFGVMPRVLINPTFDRVIGYVEGTITADKDPLQQEARERRERVKKGNK